MDIDPAIDARREPDHLRELLEAIARDPELVDADLKLEAELVHSEKRVAPVLVILAAILLIGAVHAIGWFSRTGEVVAPPPLEQNMRAMLALAVQEIEQSQEQTGAYPRRIAVADIPGDDSWRYQVLAPGRYRLTLVFGAIEVSFDSKLDSVPIVAETDTRTGGKR